MKSTLGTENSTTDRVLVWVRRVIFLGEAAGSILCMGVLAYLVALLVNSVFHVPLKYLCIVVIAALIDVGILIGFLMEGYELLWKNSKYCFTMEGIEIHILWTIKTIPWSKIVDWGVFPFFLIKRDMKRDFICFFLANKITASVVNTKDCFHVRNKMIVIRSTDETLKEVEAIMEQHSIPRIEAKSIGGSMVHCSAND